MWTGRASNEPLSPAGLNFHVQVQLLARQLLCSGNSSFELLCSPPALPALPADCMERNKVVACIH